MAFLDLCFPKLSIVNSISSPAFKNCWGLKNAPCKQGIVQDINRISYLGFISHLRRINTPLSFFKIVPHIINKRKDDNWTEEEKNKQLLKRGRYVEFNLLWDRGTQFGIKTGGNTDAILMSMPPDARWE